MATEGLLVLKGVWVIEGLLTAVETYSEISLWMSEEKGYPQKQSKIQPSICCLKV